MNLGRDHLTRKAGHGVTNFGCAKVFFAMHWISKHQRLTCNQRCASGTSLTCSVHSSEYIYSAWCIKRTCFLLRKAKYLRFYTNAHGEFTYTDSLISSGTRSVEDIFVYQASNCASNCAKY